MSALLLGLLATALAPLPVLGIPISFFGLALGAVGVAVSMWWRGESLRWSLAGLTSCLVALAINALLYGTPEGFIPGPSRAIPWRLPSHPAFVAPPAAQ